MKMKDLILLVSILFNLLLGHYYFFRSKENIITNYQIRDLRETKRQKEEVLKENIAKNEKYINNKLLIINKKKNEINKEIHQTYSNNNVTIDSTIELWNSLQSDTTSI